MKKLVLLLVFIHSFASVFSQSPDESKFRLGIGAAYVSEVESTGLGIKGIYEITEKWEVALSYSHVFENLGLSWEIVDLDGHFVFFDNDKKLNAYALAGIAFNFWKRETLLTNDTRTGSYTGLNIGAGLNIALSKRINLTPELRGTLFDLSYTRLGLSVQYMF
ncbi:outer membrane beta-barrel protein [uncultured Draconibacterium sp.]|uniref:outer membrane beta-barrel protein n=1 Tax=uncultured Draconibacterium sp. TaxID=1573823 RepID=UPI002AA7ECB2|nr:outer membrane beta-barrel protein [uncultured Draconibacterium sp.]